MTTRLSDMGTTGLVNYIMNAKAGRCRRMATINAERVITKRFHNNSVALARFRLAVEARYTAKLAML
jgi:hypothetical protein